MKDRMLNIIIGILVLIIIGIVVYYFISHRNPENEVDYERQNEEQEVSEDVG